VITLNAVIASHCGASTGVIEPFRANLYWDIGDCLRAGRPPRFVTRHSGQLSLLLSEGWKMSTGKIAVTLRGWGLGVKAGMVHSIIPLVDTGKRLGGGGRQCCVIPR